MPYELCCHVKTNGLRCESPALTDEFWCFFHHRLLTRHRNIRAIKSESPQPNLQLPPLEDRESIQLALSLIFEAIATGVLAEKRAVVLLRVIAIASRNVVGTGIQPWEIDDLVRSYCPTLDGHPLAGRRMNDNSVPAPRPRKPFIDEAPTKSAPNLG
jgi:hypothetical protein